MSATIDALKKILKAVNLSENEIFISQGLNRTVTQKDIGSDLWDVGSLIAPSSEFIMPVPAVGGFSAGLLVSDDVADDIASTGVQKVRITYLNQSGVIQTMDIDTGGTSGTIFDASEILWINKMEAIQTGANGYAEGAIVIADKNNSQMIYAVLNAADTVSKYSSMMVPAGKILNLKSWHCENNTARTATCRLRYRDPQSGIWSDIDTMALYQTTSGQIEVEVKIPALSVVKINAKMEGDPNGEKGFVTGTWLGILESE